MARGPLVLISQGKHNVYSLEVPHRGASNKYPQCMFLLRNKKITKLIDTVITVGVKEI